MIYLKKMEMSQTHVLLFSTYYRYMFIDDIRIEPIL